MKITNNKTNVSSPIVETAEKKPFHASTSFFSRFFISSPAPSPSIGKAVPLTPESSPEVLKTHQIGLATLCQVTTYGNLIGFISYLFGKAAYIEGMGYVNKRSLLKHVITHLTGNKKTGETFKSNTEMQNFVLHLIKKSGLQSYQTHVQLLNLEKFHQLKDLTQADIFGILHQVDPTGVEEIEYSLDNLGQIKEKLKPGDLIFCELTGELPATEYWSYIPTGQKLEQLFMENKTEPLDHKIVHVSIYLGNGLVAEATTGQDGEDVRIIDLEHENMELKRGAGFQYHVCRPRNSKLAAQTAAIAAKYAEDKRTQRQLLKDLQSGKSTVAHLNKKDSESNLAQAENTVLDHKQQEAILKEALKTKSSYSIRKAVRAVFYSETFGPRAKKQMLKQIIEINHESKKGKQVKHREYFCSYFAMEVLQRGMIISQLPSIKKKLAQASIPRLPKLGLDPQANKKIIKKWIDKVTREHPELVNEIAADLGINYYAKFITPQKLRVLTKQSSHLFTDIFRIVPPRERKISVMNAK